MKGAGGCSNAWTMVPCHEIIGHIVTIGDRVKEWQVGDRVGAGQAAKRGKGLLSREQLLHVGFEVSLQLAAFSCPELNRIKPAAGAHPGTCRVFVAVASQQYYCTGGSRPTAFVSEGIVGARRTRWGRASMVRGYCR